MFKKTKEFKQTSIRIFKDEFFSQFEYKINFLKHLCLYQIFVISYSRFFHHLNRTLMEIEEEYSIEKAVSDVKKAKNYLLQEYSNKHCFEHIKDFIKEVLAREVKEIVNFFESSRHKLYLSENKNHNVQTFSKIVKNHVLINEQRQERVPLPSPIQQDTVNPPND